LNIAGSHTSRGTTFIQRIWEATPIPRFQPTNTTGTTSNISSQSSDTQTPLKRVGSIPIQGLSTQDVPQLHGTENIANQSSEDDTSQDGCVAEPAELEKLREKRKIFSFTIPTLLGKEWIASLYTATIMVPHHKLLASQSPLFELRLVLTTLFIL